MKKENQISPKIISLSFAVIVLLAVTAFYIFAWTEPSVAPPNGNVAVPLNTGADGQYKIGRLQIGNSATGWISDSISGFSEPVVSNDGFIFVGGYTGAEDSDLRLYMVDNSAERFSIWSDTCGGGNCGDLNAATLKHYFTGGGDAWHSSKMTATQICIEGKSCISDWSDVTGTSYWTASGNNIYNNNSGNVGIGTTSPGALLNLKITSVDSLGGIKLTALGSTNDAGYWTENQFAMKNTNDNTFAVVLDSDGGNSYIKNGNVGIGTTNPTEKLTIGSSGGGTTRQAIRINNDGYGAPGAWNTDSNGDKIILWNNSVDADTRIGTGGGSNFWMKAMGSAGSDILQLWGSTANSGSPNQVLTVQKAGNVGIGTIAPGEKLSVNGILDMMNHKIKNVSEIDPVFGIQGKKYVSYMPDSIGQKIEVVGESQLAGNGLEIDLAKEQEGSDLWLFWQTASRESIIPFVSPQDNASLYAYIDGSKLVVKLAQGQENAKFSYRLIATRLDHAGEGSNLYSDQSVQHFIDIDSLRK